MLFSPNENLFCKIAICCFSNTNIMSNILLKTRSNDTFLGHHKTSFSHFLCMSLWSFAFISCNKHMKKIIQNIFRSYFAEMHINNNRIKFIYFRTQYKMVLLCLMFPFIISRKTHSTSL